MSMNESMLAFVERHTGLRAVTHELEITELGGGLEAASVMLVTAASSRPTPLRFVVKVLAGRARREAEIYRCLSSKNVDAAARALWIDDAGRHEATLYLEALSRPEAWPWGRLETARAVLDELAALHASFRREPSATLPSWDYEAELATQGEELCRTLERLPRTGELQALRRSLPPLRRLVKSIPRWRAHLLEMPLLPRTLIHGDLHTANVLFRIAHASARPASRPVLIDWGRARMGSPLEDVSSWLQSLGYWEPRARLKHDTLLKSYLALSGLTLSEEIRTAYWLAGASNALAGALRYHVERAVSAADGGTRGEALAAARDWLRIVRRADIRWRVATPRGGVDRRSE